MKLRETAGPVQWSLLRGFYVLCLTIAFGGCASQQTHVARKPSTAFLNPSNAAVAEYRVGCPDVLQVSVPNHPHLSGEFHIRPDGRIDFGKHGEMRVEGRTTEEIAQRLAIYSGNYPQFVTVAVAEYGSQRILVFGEVVGWQRSVAYRGPERVADVVRRAGGLSDGASPEKIYVVRTHIADGGRPEIFHIDWQAITEKNEHKSNIVIQPFDQIYVGESHRSRIGKSLPRYLASLVRIFTGPATAPKAEPAPPQHSQTNRQPSQIRHVLWR